jgi:hypothetical protein
LGLVEFHQVYFVLFECYPPDWVWFMVEFVTSHQAGIGLVRVLGWV